MPAERTRELPDVIMQTLGLIRDAGSLENARRLQWLTYVSQELGLTKRHFDFVFCGAEAFSREVDLSLGILEAAGLVRDTGTAGSLVLTERGHADAPEESLDLEAIRGMSTQELARVGRLLYLRASGVPQGDLTGLAATRFLMHEEAATRALQLLKQLSCE